MMLGENMDSKLPPSPTPTSTEAFAPQGVCMSSSDEISTAIAGYSKNMNVENQGMMYFKNCFKGQRFQVNSCSTAEKKLALLN